MTQAFKLYQDKVVCNAHELEVCTTCKMDWRVQNEIAKSLKRPRKANVELKTQIEQLRAEGDEAVKTNEAEKAIEKYTSALELVWSRPLLEPMAHKNSKEELIGILSQRSGAYMMLDKYVEALVDVEMVMKLNKSWAEGWQRKGEALTGLKREREAAMAFKRCFFK